MAIHQDVDPNETHDGNDLSERKTHQRNGLIYLVFGLALLTGGGISLLLEIRGFEMMQAFALVVGLILVVGALVELTKARQTGG